MSDIERTYTFEDMRLVSMYARLEGAPATVEAIIGDLDAKGNLSPPTTTQGAVSLDALREIARDMYAGRKIGSPEQLAVSEFLGRAESLGRGAKTGGLCPMTNTERAYERGMQEGLDLRDELRGRIDVLAEQLGDRDQDVVILTRQLAEAVEVIRDLLPAWLNGWKPQQDIIDRAEAALDR